MMLPARSALVLLGRIWAFPCTLVGYLLVLISGATKYKDCDYVSWYMMKRKILYDPMVAITFGTVVLLKRDVGDYQPSLEAHEHTHVVQFMEFSVLFWIVYGIDFVVKLVRYGDFMQAYHGLVFEQAAVRSQAAHALKCKAEADAKGIV